MGACRLSERCRRLRAIAEKISNLKLRSNIDGLGHPGAGDHAQQRLMRGGLARRLVAWMSELVTAAG